MATGDWLPYTTATTGEWLPYIAPMKIAVTDNNIRMFKCHALSKRIVIRICSIYEYDEDVIVTQADTHRLLLGLYDMVNEIDTLKKITDFLTDDEYAAYVSLES